MPHTPPRKLLLATERTEFDAGVERVAIALARRLGCSLDVVLPLPSNPEYLGTAPGVALQAERSAVAALDDLQAQARAGGVLANVTVRRGETLWEEIVAAARGEQADLLLTRRIGRRGLLARLLVGEMVSQVAAHAPCPHLMVPAVASDLWSGRVLVSDADSGGPAGKLAAELAKVAGATFVPCNALELAQACARDLIVIGLGAGQVGAGRLARAVETLIGGAAGPTLLVREDGRAERA